MAMNDNMKLKIEIGGLSKEIRSLSAQNDSFREVIKDLSDKKPDEIKADPASLTKLIESLNQPRLNSGSDQELIRINDELSGQVKLLRQQISTEQEKFQKLLIEKETIKPKLTEATPTQCQPSPTQVVQNPTETLFLSTNYHAIKDELDVTKTENNSYLKEISNLNEKISQLENEVNERDKQFEQNNEKWTHDKNKMEEKLSGLNVELENMTAELSACSVNLQEFDQLKETLSKSGDEIKIDLSEAIGALANVRLELVKQKRIERVVKHDLENLKKRLDQQKSDIVSLRTSRLTETQSASHIRKRYDLHLQKLKQELESAVPKHQLIRVQSELKSACRKLREFSEKSITDVISDVQLSSLNEKLGKETAQKEFLMKELELSKEKCAKIEDRMAKIDISEIPGDEDAESLRSKIAILEMKELNERQKAQHLELKNKELEVIQKTQFARINDLESSFKALSEQTLKQAEIEANLRKSLANSVPVEVAEDTKTLLKTTAEENIHLHQEVEKYKNLAEIEETQTTQLRNDLLMSTEKIERLESLMSDSAAFDTDHSATLLLLHREISNLKEEITEKDTNLQFHISQSDRHRQQAKLAEETLRQRDLLLSLLMRESHQRVRQGLKMQFFEKIKINDKS